MPNNAYSFNGLMVQQVISHRIHPKNEQREIVPPKISKKVIPLSVQIKDTLQRRLTKALGNRSHGIEMSIVNTESGSFFDTAARILHKNEQGFIDDSAIFATTLTQAQSSTTAPGGVLFVVSGRVGDDSKPFLCVIKAEPQDGFNAKDDEEGITIEYLEQLLLTDSTRLFKIGFLVAETTRPESEIQAKDYRALLFDHLMTLTETRPAAAYFYNAFLGMSIAESSKKLTQNFYEYTGQFIDASDLSDEAKLDAHEALRVTLRSEAATLSVNDFAQTHLPEEKRDAYENFMKDKGFPQNAVNKDTAYIISRLRRRRTYKFNNDVRISTPPGETKDYLTIESSDDAHYTLVRIKGQIAQQG